MELNRRKTDVTVLPRMKKDGKGCELIQEYFVYIQWSEQKSKGQHWRNLLWLEKMKESNKILGTYK